MDVDLVTPVVLTYDESENIKRTLANLCWAKQVVVVDSYSNDDTVSIVKQFQNVSVYQHVFDNHTDQWNFALSCVATEWVLVLDADYMCPRALFEELLTLNPQVSVYFARFRYCVLGRPLPASLYPPRAVLFRPSQFKYQPDGHTQVLDTTGCSFGFLDTRIDHDDRKSVSRWCSSQVKYAELEADKLVSTPSSQCRLRDRLRKVPFVAPVLVLFYCLLMQRMLFAGRAGLYYTAQRVFAEFLLSLVLLDRRLRRSSEISRSAC